MEEGQASDYDQLKKAILKGYNINGEATVSERESRRHVQKQGS